MSDDKEIKTHTTEDDEYLERAKKRALAYLDQLHDPAQAFTSMLSDMTKNPHFRNHAGNMIGTGMMLIPGWITNPVEVRRWIEGYR
jgi:hypothetical protein